MPAGADVGGVLLVRDEIAAQPEVVGDVDRVLWLLVVSSKQVVVGTAHHEGTSQDADEFHPAQVEDGEARRGKSGRLRVAIAHGPPLERTGTVDDPLAVLPRQVVDGRPADRRLPGE
jgi:hypothetical protein